MRNTNNRGHFRGRNGGGRGRNGGSSFITVNTNLDSNGPCGKVRGNVLQLVERYLAAAKDAKSADDRVLEENCLQHAEHYLRMNATLLENEESKKEQQALSSNSNVNVNDENPSADLSAGDASESALSDKTTVLEETEEDKEEADVLNNVVNMDLSLPDLNAPKKSSSRRRLSLKKASPDI